MKRSGKTKDKGSKDNKKKEGKAQLSSAIRRVIKQQYEKKVEEEDEAKKEKFRLRKTPLGNQDDVEALDEEKPAHGSSTDKEKAAKTSSEGNEQSSGIGESDLPIDSGSESEEDHHKNETDPAQKEKVNKDKVNNVLLRNDWDRNFDLQ